MQKTLIYFADPMCSWCWGFSPVIERIAGEYQHEVQLKLIMGGLYPAPGQEMNAASRRNIRAHWEHVQATAGAEFDFSFFDRESFVYNTEPASRAVVAAASLDPHSALPFMRRLQRLFYTGNTDITVKAELVRQADLHGFDTERFETIFDSEACEQEVHTHFEAARSAGVTGLPTLFAVDEKETVRITSGYAQAEQVEAKLASWLTRGQPH